MASQKPHKSGELKDRKKPVSKTSSQGFTRSAGDASDIPFELQNMRNPFNLPKFTTPLGLGTSKERKEKKKTRLEEDDDDLSEFVAQELSAKVNEPVTKKPPTPKTVKGIDVNVDKPKIAPEKKERKGPPATLAKLKAAGFESLSRTFDVTIEDDMDRFRELILSRRIKDFKENTLINIVKEFFHLRHNILQYELHEAYGWRYKERKIYEDFPTGKFTDESRNKSPDILLIARDARNLIKSITILDPTVTWQPNLANKNKVTKYMKLSQELSMNFKCPVEVHGLALKPDCSNYHDISAKLMMLGYEPSTVNEERLRKRLGDMDDLRQVLFSQIPNSSGFKEKLFQKIDKDHVMEISEIQSTKLNLEGLDFSILNENKFCMEHKTPFISANEEFENDFLKFVKKECLENKDYKYTEDKKLQKDDLKDFFEHLEHEKKKFPERITPKLDLHVPYVMPDSKFWDSLFGKLEDSKNDIDRIEQFLSIFPFDAFDDILGETRHDWMEHLEIQKKTIKEKGFKKSLIVKEFLPDAPHGNMLSLTIQILKGLRLMLFSGKKTKYNRTLFSGDQFITKENAPEVFDNKGHKITNWQYLVKNSNLRKELPRAGNLSARGKNLVKIHDKYLNNSSIFEKLMFGNRHDRHHVAETNEEKIDRVLKGPETLYDLKVGYNVFESLIEDLSKKPTTLFATPSTLVEPEGETDDPFFVTEKKTMKHKFDHYLTFLKESDTYNFLIDRFKVMKSFILESQHRLDENEIKFLLPNRPDFIHIRMGGDHSKKTNKGFPYITLGYLKPKQRLNGLFGVDPQISYWDFEKFTIFITRPRRYNVDKMCHQYNAFGSVLSSTMTSLLRKPYMSIDVMRSIRRVFAIRAITSQIVSEKFVEAVADSMPIYKTSISRGSQTVENMKKKWCHPIPDYATSWVIIQSIIRLGDIAQQIWEKKSFFKMNQASFENNIRNLSTIGARVNIPDLWSNEIITDFQDYLDSAYLYVHTYKDPDSKYHEYVKAFKDIHESEQYYQNMSDDFKFGYDEKNDHLSFAKRFFQEDIKMGCHRAIIEWATTLHLEDTRAPVSTCLNKLKPDQLLSTISSTKGSALDILIDQKYYVLPTGLEASTLKRMKKHDAATFYIDNNIETVLDAIKVAFKAGKFYVFVAIKDQYGAKREFYVVNYGFNCLRQFIEDFWKSMCSTTEEEFIHHPGNLKIMKLEEFMNYVQANFQNEKQSMFYVNGDCKKWSLAETMSSFWAMSHATLAGQPEEVLNLFKSELTMFTKKEVVVPKIMWEKLTSGLTPEALDFYSKTYVHKTHDGEMITYPLVSNFLMGFKNYASSYKALICYKFIMRSWNIMYPEYPIQLYKVAAHSDDYIFIALWKHPKMLSKFRHYQQKIMTMFGIKDSPTKTFVSDNYAEFISVFVCNGQIYYPLIKKAKEIGLNIEAKTFLTDSYVSKQRSGAYIENGGCFMGAYIVKRFQNFYISDAYRTGLTFGNEKNINDPTKKLGLPHDQIPCELFGLDYMHPVFDILPKGNANNFRIYKYGSDTARKLLHILDVGLIFGDTDDMVEIGQNLREGTSFYSPRFKYTYDLGPAKSFREYWANHGWPKERIDNYFNEKPYLLFTSPLEKKDQLPCLIGKYHNRNFAESYAFNYANKVLGRISSWVKGKSLEVKMIFNNDQKTNEVIEALSAVKKSESKDDDLQGARYDNYDFYPQLLEMSDSDSDVEDLETKDARRERKIRNPSALDKVFDTLKVNYKKIKNTLLSKGTKKDILEVDKIPKEGKKERENKNKPNEKNEDSSDSDMDIYSDDEEESVTSEKFTILEYLEQKELEEKEKNRKNPFHKDHKIKFSKDKRANLEQWGTDIQVDVVKTFRQKLIDIRMYDEKNNIITRRVNPHINYDSLSPQTLFSQFKPHPNLKDPKMRILQEQLDFMRNIFKLRRYIDYPEIDLDFFCKSHDFFRIRVQYMSILNNTPLEEEHILMSKLKYSGNPAELKDVKSNMIKSKRNIVTAVMTMSEYLELVAELLTTVHIPISKNTAKSMMVALTYGETTTEEIYNWSKQQTSGNLLKFVHTRFVSGFLPMRRTWLNFDNDPQTILTYLFVKDNLTAESVKYFPRAKVESLVADCEKLSQFVQVETYIKSGKLGVSKLYRIMRNAKSNRRFSFVTGRTYSVNAYLNESFQKIRHMNHLYTINYANEKPVHNPFTLDEDYINFRNQPPAYFTMVLRNMSVLFAFLYRFNGSSISDIKKEFSNIMIHGPKEEQLSFMLFLNRLQWEDILVIPDLNLRINTVFMMYLLCGKLDYFRRLSNVERNILKSYDLSKAKFDIKSGRWNGDDRVDYIVDGNKSTAKIKNQVFEVETDANSAADAFTAFKFGLRFLGQIKEKDVKYMDNTTIIKLFSTHYTASSRSFQLAIVDNKVCYTNDLTCKTCLPCFKVPTVMLRTGLEPYIDPLKTELRIDAKNLIVFVENYPKFKFNPFFTCTNQYFVDDKYKVLNKYSLRNIFTEGVLMQLMAGHKVSVPNFDFSDITRASDYQKKYPMRKDIEIYCNEFSVYAKYRAKYDPLRDNKIIETKKEKKKRLKDEEEEKVLKASPNIFDILRSDPATDGLDAFNEMFFGDIDLAALPLPVLKEEESEQNIQDKSFEDFMGDMDLKGFSLVQKPSIIHSRAFEGVRAEAELKKVEIKESERDIYETLGEYYLWLEALTVINPDELYSHMEFSKRIKQGLKDDIFDQSEIFLVNLYLQTLSEKMQGRTFPLGDYKAEIRSHNGGLTVFVNLEVELKHNSLQKIAINTLKSTIELKKRFIIINEKAFKYDLDKREVIPRGRGKIFLSVPLSFEEFEEFLSTQKKSQPIPLGVNTLFVKMVYRRFAPKITDSKFAGLTVTELEPMGDDVHGELEEEASDITEKPEEFYGSDVE